MMKIMITMMMSDDHDDYGIDDNDVGADSDNVDNECDGSNHDNVDGYDDDDDDDDTDNHAHVRYDGGEGQR